MTSQRQTQSKMAANIERVELYFEVNEIDKKKQAVALLTAVSGKTYSLLRNLVAPQLLKEKSFAQLKEILMAHFEPKLLVIAERFRFHQRSQQEIESFQEYVTELKRMAKHCNFRTYLNEALCDRLVCGLRNKAIQKQLLSEAELTFERAIQIAQGMESAERNCSELHGTEAVCQAKEAIVSVKSTENERGGRNKSRRANWLQSEVQPVDGREDEPESSMYNLDHVASQPMVVQPVVNGKSLKMELDTVAAVSIITEETKVKEFPGVVLRNSDVILRTYTTQQMPVVGVMDVQVNGGNHWAKILLYVVKGKGPSLVGRDWLKKIRFDWKAIWVSNGAA